MSLRRRCSSPVGSRGCSKRSIKSLAQFWLAKKEEQESLGPYMSHRGTRHFQEIKASPFTTYVQYICQQQATELRMVGSNPLPPFMYMYERHESLEHFSTAQFKARGQFDQMTWKFFDFYKIQIFRSTLIDLFFDWHPSLVANGEPCTLSTVPFSDGFAPRKWLHLLQIKLSSFKVGHSYEENSCTFSQNTCAREF